MSAALVVTALAATLDSSAASAATPARGTVATGSVAAPSVGAPPSGGLRSAGSGGGLPPISSLEVTGTRTSVVVHKVYRTGQLQWINHVLDSSLTNRDGCQGRRSGPNWHRSVYRASVESVCQGGAADVRAAVGSLGRSRPWYRIAVADVPLVGFTLLADLPSGGNDKAVPAALAQLPRGDFTFAEGDDVSLSFVGPDVTQAQLGAAVQAFAGALEIPASQVRVGPLFG